jgi:hypothetical protein
VPRHTLGRFEAVPSVAHLVTVAQGRVRLSAFVWGGAPHQYASLSIGVAYELGRELVDAAESALLAAGETEARRGAGDRLLSGVGAAPDPGRVVVADARPRTASIRPGLAVDCGA